MDAYKLTIVASILLGVLSSNGCGTPDTDATSTLESVPSIEQQDSLVRAIEFNDSTGSPLLHVFTVTEDEAAGAVPELALDKMMDIAWDQATSRLFVLHNRREAPALSIYDEDGRTIAEIQTLIGMLVGSRLFKVDTTVSFLAKKWREPQEYLISVDIENKPFVELRTSVAGLEHHVESDPVINRRNVLLQIAPDMPFLFVDSIDYEYNITGYPAPIEEQLRAYPVMLGHPNKPVAAFDPAFKTLAMSFDELLVSRHDGNQWQTVHMKKRVQQEIGSAANNGLTAYSADATESLAAFGITAFDSTGSNPFVARIAVNSEPFKIYTSLGILARRLEIISN